ncbi:MAG: PIN domain-containing protein [Limnospira sp.]
MAYLLDTNIVSLAMKGDRYILNRIKMLNLSKTRVAICGVTYFEIRRGLLAKNAIRQIEKFEAFRQSLPMILLDDLAIFERAAVIHADLKKRGLPIQTEDILIAATGMVKELTVVSRDRDLGRIEGLDWQTWEDGEMGS